MDIKILKILGNWRDVADAARTTVHKEAGEGEPSSNFKRRILLAEHSPIRKISINWIWFNLFWWVQTHFTRHKFGVEWFVSTSREDRTGVDRKQLTQYSPVDVEGIANAQAMINITRKRKCKQASKETRDAWIALLDAIKDIQPELYSVCVPECIYRNGFCPEIKSCGWNHTKEFEEQLKNYLSNMENQINRHTNILRKDELQ